MLLLLSGTDGIRRKNPKQRWSQRYEPETNSAPTGGDTTEDYKKISSTRVDRGERAKERENTRGDVVLIIVEQRVL
jgi:hypothetical protein